MIQIAYRHAEVDETDAIQSFYAKHLRPNHIYAKDKDVFLWHFEQNPYVKNFSSSLSIIGAYQAETLVGIISYHPVPLNLFGERKWCAFWTTWIVNEELRDKAVGIRLLFEFVRLRFDTYFGWYTESHAVPLYKGLGWHHIPLVSRYVRVLFPARLQSLLNSSSDLPSQFRKPESPSSSSTSKVWEVIDLTEIDWDLLLQYTQTHDSFGPIRELEFYQWRYQKCPHFKYHILSTQNSKDEGGLLVYRVESVKDTDEKVVRVLDLLGSPSCTTALLCDVIERAREVEALLIDFFYLGSKLNEVLLDCGFLVDEKDGAYEIPFRFQPIDHNHLVHDMVWRENISNSETKMQVADLSNWHVCRGDGKSDRPS